MGLQLSQRCIRHLTWVLGLPGGKGVMRRFPRGAAPLCTQPVPHLQELLLLKAEVEDFSGRLL